MLINESFHFQKCKGDFTDLVSLFLLSLNLNSTDQLELADN